MTIHWWLKSGQPESLEDFEDDIDNLPNFPSFTLDEARETLDRLFEIHRLSTDVEQDYDDDLVYGRPRLSR